VRPERAGALGVAILAILAGLNRLDRVARADQ
jgi:hypothetical protein